MQHIRIPLAALALALAIAPAAIAQTAGGAMSACKGDIATLCPNVQPGGGRIGECLKAHKDQVSMGCKLAIAQDMAARRQGAGGAAAPKPQ